MPISDSASPSVAKVSGLVWPENSIRRIPSSTKGYISVRNFGICESASVLVTTPGGSNSANTLYTYQAGPTVASISPSSGPLAGAQSVTITGTAYGPKTRSAESQGQPRVTSPSETSGFATRRGSRKLHGSNRRRQNRGHGA